MSEEEAIETIKAFVVKSQGTKEELENLITAIRVLSRLYPQFMAVADEMDKLRPVDILDVVLSKIDTDKTSEDILGKIDPKFGRLYTVKFSGVEVVHGHAWVEDNGSEQVLFWKAPGEPDSRPYTVITPELQPYCTFSGRNYPGVISGREQE